ncbi:hypothetical protein Plec18167_009554 [Paecilomyces lecythidis]|uniref:Uncharacterized protein n=1 Tax=Paecilomyces lecythidis TaxID=3004212 RepID=A0ABR3WNE5_9EURO
MSVPILALFFTAFNAWGFYAGIPGTNINPARSISERFLGSLQLTSSLYVFSEVAKYVHSLPDEAPQVGGDTYRSSITSGNPEATFGDHGHYTDNGHIFVSFPPEAETSVAPASSTALPRQTSDDKVYERRVYTVLETPVRPRGRGPFLDDPNNLPWIIVGLSWMFIFTMNIKQGDVRNTWPRDPRNVFDTVPEAIIEPIKKSAEAMNSCLKAINDLAEKYEKLPLTDIRVSSEKLSQSQLFVNDFQEKLQELIALKKDENSSLLERALRDIHSLQEENKSLTDRMSNVQGQLQVMQSQWKPQEDFGPRIDAIERLFDERLKRAEKQLDSLDSAASTKSVKQLEERLKTSYTRLESDFENLQKDMQSLRQDTARESDVQQIQQREEKMRADILDLQKSLEGVRSDLDNRLLDTATKETPQAPDSTHQAVIDQLQKDLEDLQSEVQKYLYPTVSTPLSKQPGIDRTLRDHIREFERRLLRLEIECQEKFAKLDDIVSAVPTQSSGGDPVQDAQGQHANPPQVIDSSRISSPKDKNGGTDLKKELDELKNEVKQKLDNIHLADILEERLKSAFSETNEKLDNVSGNVQNINVLKVKELAESNAKEIIDIKSTVSALQQSTEERFTSIISSLESNLPQEEGNKVADQLHESFSSLGDKVEKLLKRVPTAKKVDDILKVGNLERKKVHKDLTQLQHFIMHLILHKADKEDLSSIKELKESLGTSINSINEIFTTLHERLGFLESEIQTEKDSSEELETEIFRLRDELNGFRDEMDTRLAGLQSNASPENLESSVSTLCSEVSKLQKRMQRHLDSCGAADSVHKVAALKKEVENELVKYNNSLKYLQDDLTAKGTDIEFIKSEIEKLNAAGTTQTRTLGAHIIPEKELKEVQVKVDSAHEKLRSLEQGQTILERKINPILEKSSGHGVRLSSLEARTEQEQRALRGVAKDVDKMMLKLRDFDAPHKPATTEPPKVESQQPKPEEKKEPEKEAPKKETSRPSSSLAKETPEKRGPGLSASRWATDMPTSPALTPEEAREFARIQSSKKRGGRK